MKTSDYNCLIDKVLEFFYKKDNLGILSFDEWKVYIKDYESEEDMVTKIATETELERINSFLK